MTALDRSAKVESTRHTYRGRQYSPEEMQMLRSLGDLVRKAREERGFSLELLSRRSKVPLKVLEKIEAGKLPPAKIPDLLAIEVELGKKPLSLMVAAHEQSETSSAKDDGFAGK